MLEIEVELPKKYRVKGSAWSRDTQEMSTVVQEKDDQQLFYAFLCLEGLSTHFYCLYLLSSHSSPFKPFSVIPHLQSPFSASFRCISLPLSLQYCLAASSLSFVHPDRKETKRKANVNTVFQI